MSLVSAFLVFPLLLCGHAAKQEPPQHFLSSTDTFLRASGNRVGEVVSKVLTDKQNLDDMRNDLSGEYERWQSTKKAMGSAKSLLEKEIGSLQAQLLEQNSLSEEKVRLGGELLQHRSQIEKAGQAKNDVPQKWEPEREAMKKDIAMLENQIRVSEIRKIDAINAAQNQTSNIQARNRGLQSQIFTTNQQVINLEQTMSNRSVTNQQRHSGLLTEIGQLQLQIHGLQDEVVRRSQVQLDLQQHYTRVAAQAGQVVQQKESLQSARIACEQDLRRIDLDIHAAQKSLKASNGEMVHCQRLDAQAQQLQGQLNECKAAQLSSR